MLCRNAQDIVWDEMKIPVQVNGHKISSDYVPINLKSIIRKVLSYYLINCYHTTFYVLQVPMEIREKI